MQQCIYIATAYSQFFKLIVVQLLVFHRVTGCTYCISRLLHKTRCARFPFLKLSVGRDARSTYPHIPHFNKMNWSTVTLYNLREVPMRDRKPLPWMEPLHFPIFPFWCICPVLPMLPLSTPHWVECYTLPVKCRRGQCTCLLKKPVLLLLHSCLHPFNGDIPCITGQKHR